MPTIIRNLPVDDARAVLHVHERPVAVFAFQAVVWVSIVPVRPQSLDPLTPRFPAVVDLGYNGTFAIREEHLREWAGMDPRLFRRLRSTQLRGAPSDQRLASLWLHPNEPNTRQAPSRSPFPLDLHHGMTVMRRPVGTDQQDHRPRLPLIGFRALHTAGLEVVVDCKRCRLSIRTVPRFWLFA